MHRNAAVPHFICRQEHLLGNPEFEVRYTLESRRPLFPKQNKSNLTRAGNDVRIHFASGANLKLLYWLWLIITVKKYSHVA